MSTIDVNNLLSQMRQMTAQVRAPEAAVKPAAAVGQADFSDVLKQSLSAVGRNQLEAGHLAASFERGDPGADLGRTMIAVQKADLSLRTVVEVRNKLVDAYKEIMNMPV
ncbi:flagellar hook-basal body complex protein FliE [Rhodanobacter denitrificans]|uniref:Flagellar hook-basal body complex protein FliE n=1 Tax=Rhodanobacter denitrificans TaxID=666685 RepID=M4NK75_9GAMM|nr:flagellar hook-basal body complex protein FliE [Rhodanobacter denitrificans]AGG90073.1 flagellar hook-basal body complex protein FliE [Rhodanobacter denitrificans]UJM85463.1 flagellar hook-basal body complex protein FliE [Rhodanobacter denitrificans]